MMTCINKEEILKMEGFLREKYGQLRISTDSVRAYFRLSWDFSEKGFVFVAQLGMLQDLTSNREKVLCDGGIHLPGNPHSPGAS